MKLKPIVITIVVLAALSAAMYWFNRPEQPTAVDPRVGKPLIDAAAIDRAQMLRISDQGKTIELTRESDGSWRNDSYFGFPAEFSKLSSFVGDLTGASIQRLVTTSPARISRLEFKDTRIELRDASDHPLWSLTLGKMGEPSGRFVRFDDEPKAYFANLNIWLDTDAKGWSASSLLELKADSVAKVEIPFAAGGPVVVSRAKKDAPWTADKTPSGQQVKADKISSILSSLSPLRFSDTKDLSDPEAAVAKKYLRTFKLTTFDGKEITVAMGRKPEEKKLKPPPPPEKKTEAKTDGKAAKPEAKPATAPKPPAPEYETIPAGPVYVWITHSDSKASINKLMQKRTFQIDDYAFTGLPDKTDDLFEPLPPPPAPAAKPAGKMK